MNHTVVREVLELAAKDAESRTTSKVRYGVWAVARVALIPSGATLNCGGMPELRVTEAGDYYLHLVDPGGQSHNVELDSIVILSTESYRIKE